MESASTDVRWLDAAARLATGALGSTGAGPAIGAIVVEPRRRLLVGRAITPPRGQGQAELLALAEAGELAAGGTLYLTHEPTARFERLAPATEGIIRAGVQRVVVGALDADADRSGQGLAALKGAGIDAVCLAHAASARLAEGHITRTTKGRPFVTLKMTLSPDGMVGYGQPGTPNPLGVEAQRFVERERAAAGAVISGAARAEIEDNDLSVHLEGLDRRDGLRIVLAGSRELDTNLDVFARVSGVPLLVVTTTDRPLVLRPGVEVLAVEGRHGRPDLRLVMQALAERGVSRAFVEAGARLAKSFMAGELVDRLHLIETAEPIGRTGVLAAMLGRFEDRIAASRFSEVDRRLLGEDKVRTFERL